MSCPKCGREGQPTNTRGTEFFCFNCDEDYFVDRGRKPAFEIKEGPVNKGGLNPPLPANHTRPRAPGGSGRTLKEALHPKDKAEFPPAQDVEHTIRGKIRKLKRATRVHVDLSPCAGKKGPKADTRPRLIINRGGEVEIIQLHNRLAEELIALGLSYGT